MDHIIRFTQTHPSFRLAEIEAISTQIKHLYARKGFDVRVKVLDYREGSPFCIVRFHVRRRGTNRHGRKLDAENGRMTERETHRGRETSTVNGSGGATDPGAWRDEQRGDGESDADGYGNDRSLKNQIARDFVSLSIQAKGIYELWGFSSPTHHPENSSLNPISTTSTTTSTNINLRLASPPSPNLHTLYTSLHASTHALSSHLWPQYAQTPSFKFSIDSFQGKRSEAEKREIINSFAYFGLEGRVTMKGAREEWCIMEEWVSPAAASGFGEEEAGNVGGKGENGAEKGEDEGNGESMVGGGNRDGEWGQGSDQGYSMTLQQNTCASTSTLPSTTSPAPQLSRLFLTLHLAHSRRQLIEKHSLKTRPYISTTSMDAELALITANLALASPGKVFLDPFCGTGGFMVAAAELGCWVMGADIDGRSYRGNKSSGKGKGGGAAANFGQYKLEGLFGDCFTGDLVHTPLRKEGRRWLDGVICDPPYGVREGLKVLGSKKSDPPHHFATSMGNREEGVPTAKQPHLINGIPAHTLPEYIAPKKPYSFERMLDDILDFAARTLVDGGRLAFWMPSANENEETGEEEVTLIPRHALMKLKHECVQRFNKWSRRLLVYERVPGEVVQDREMEEVRNGMSALAVSGTGTRADDLNPFRRRYFQAFAEKPNG